MQLAATYFAGNNAVPPFHHQLPVASLNNPPPSSLKRHMKADEWTAGENCTSNGNKLSLLCSQQPGTEHY